MSSILYSVKESVAHITLNRPEKLNSFNREMALLLQAKLDEAATDDGVRCIYLTGAGKGFSAGQDLEEIVADNGIDTHVILSEHYNPIIVRLRSIAKPIVCAVNGVAAGAGANIALACDVVVAHENASFIQAFSKIGLIPDSGGTFTLPRLIGFQRASALMMLGDKVSATAALQMGMLYKVFTADNFETESWKLATTLANMPTKALGFIKHTLNASLDNNLANQLSIEDTVQQQASSTSDYKEGVAAFLEKRLPNFTGA
jgi:2-(1,2-epoxy-1,2-dihydrophenyl)acetyl-CoA isomerase